ncbi:MAG: hypothetical protein QOJ07_2743 [Thermoleophilaceae bacterium]|nr:hypothetical protein [Thermoleophilaceae bacterium]
MAPRRDRMAPWAFALLVVAWLAMEFLTGTEMGLLYLAPALVLALPLILGRYVGEEQLAVLTTASPAPAARAAADIPSPRSHVRVMHRGGRLVASAMAKRPPPGRAQHATA